MHRHRVIICEDDPVVAQVLVEILAMIDCDSLVVTTVDEFRAAFLRYDPCCGLQDLQLPVNASTKATAASGERCIEFARKHKPEIHERRHRYPIIVVTSVVAGPGYGIELARLGADDFLEKPCGDPAVVHEKVMGVLERAGRKDHESCIALARGATAEAASSALMLAITGERKGQRTLVTLAGKRVPLRGKALELLVRLIDGRLRGENWISRKDLKIAGTNDGAFRLNEHFWDNDLFPREFLVVESNGLSECRLNPAIELGQLAWPELAKHPIGVVAKIATERAPKRKP